MLNLDAPIIPGKSSAGFQLGDSLEEVLKELGELENWSGTPQLVETISSSMQWLRVDNSFLSNEALLGCSVYSPGGLVTLDFNANDVLFNISVFQGYRGLLFDHIKVGDTLKMLHMHVSTEYDDSDEVHYAIANDSIQGLALYADEDTLERSPDQIIRGISVFI